MQPANLAFTMSMTRTGMRMRGLRYRYGLYEFGLFPSSAVTAFPALATREGWPATQARLGERRLVEPTGIEPVTSSLQS